MDVPIRPTVLHIHDAHIGDEIDILAPAPND